MNIRLVRQASVGCDGLHSTFSRKVTEYDCPEMFTSTSDTGSLLCLHYSDNDT